MRTILTWAAALGLAACFTTSASAQGPRGGMMGGQTGVALLANKSVQKELKLSDEQIEKADKAATEMREKMQEKFSELRDLDQQERQEKMQSLMKEMSTESKKAADGILKPEQTKRLTQIQYQVMGFGAFSDPDVQAKLKMTDEQKNKVKDLQEESMTQMRDLREQFQNDREGAMKKMTEMRTELANKATAMLSDDQKKSWKELTGEKFEFVPDAPRRRN